MVAIMNILIPLYMYPDGCAPQARNSACAWNPYFAAVEANTAYTFTFVINVDSGPGPVNSYPDSNWKSVLAQVNSYSNTRTVGYVDSGFTQVTPATYNANIGTYVNWKNYASADIHMDGIFVDDMSSTKSKLPYYVTMANSIKSAFPSTSEKYIVMNPGTPVDCSFYGNVSNIVTFEDYYSNLNSNSPFLQSKYSACPRSMQTVIAHTFTGSATDQQQLSDTAGETWRVGDIYVTTVSYDNNPYGSISALWSQLASSATATDNWITTHPQWYSRMIR